MNCNDIMSLTKNQERTVSESSSSSSMDHLVSTTDTNYLNVSTSISQKRNRRYFAIRPTPSTTSKQSNKIKNENENECINVDTTYYNSYFDDEDKSNLYCKKRRIDINIENSFVEDYDGKTNIRQIKDEDHEEQYITSLSPLLQAFKQNNKTALNNLDEIWCEKQAKSNDNLNNQFNSPTSASTISRNCSPFSPTAISPSSSGIGSSANTSATTFSEQNGNVGQNQAASPLSSSSLFSPMFNLPNLLQLAKTVNADLNLLENTQSVLNTVNNLQQLPLRVPSSNKSQKKLKFSIDDILHSEEVYTFLFQINFFITNLL